MAHGKAVARRAPGLSTVEMTVVADALAWTGVEVQDAAAGFARRLRS